MSGILAARQTLMWRHPDTLWDATLKVNKTSRAAYLNSGWLAMQRGQPDKALEMFQKALEIEPRLAIAYQNMAVIYRGKGDLESAKRMIEKAIELRPDDDVFAMVLGAILGEQKKYDEAIQVLTKSLEANPRSATLRTQLGVSYFDAGREGEALRELSAAQKLDPLLPDPYIQKAQILLSKSDVDGAITLLKKAVSLRTLPEAHNMLGVAYAAKGNLPMALSEFFKAYKLDPNLSGVRDNLANALMDMARFGQAREFCLESERAGRPCSTDTLFRLKEPVTDHR
jgi:tetratricopeptide (TPR) repeat protein